MIKKKEINIPIFDQTVIVLLGDKHEIIDYLQDVYATDSLQDLINKGFIAACCNYNGLPHIVLDQETFEIEQFLHELAHATFTILD